MAVSRRAWWPTFSVPIVKLPLAVVWQSEGGPDDGAMPSGTAWAMVVAATNSGARRCEARIVGRLN